MAPKRKHGDRAAAPLEGRLKRVPPAVRNPSGDGENPFGPSLKKVDSNYNPRAPTYDDLMQPDKEVYAEEAPNPNKAKNRKRAEQRKRAKARAKEAAAAAEAEAKAKASAEAKSGPPSDGDGDGDGGKFPVSILSTCIIL